MGRRQPFFDPQLVDLPLALNPEWMLPQMRDWLGRGEAPFRIQRCRLQRFRYRPGKRLVCLYELELQDPLSGSSWRHWISGIMSADGSVDKLYRRGRRAAAGRLQGRLSAPPPRLLNKPRMVLQHFPDDHHLPQLGALFASLPPALEQLYRDHFGGRDFAVEHPLPVRYRPLLSAVLSQRGYRHPEGGLAGQSWHAYLKIRADDSGALRYQRQRQLCEYRGGLGLDTVTPVGFIAPLHLQVDLRVPGTSLYRRLQAGAVSNDDWANLGERLACFHRSDAPVTARVGLESRLGRAKAAAKLIGWSQPALETALEGLIDALAQHGEDPIWGPCHGDLKPEHLFFDQERIAVIDLEDLCRANPLFDVALLLARLELMALCEPPPVDLVAGTCLLLDAYWGAVPATWQGYLGAPYACAALDMARYVVQHQVAGWPQHCHYFFQRAQAAISKEWSYAEGLLSLDPMSPVNGQPSLEPRNGRHLDE